MKDSKENLSAVFQTFRVKIYRLISGRGSSSSTHNHGNKSEPSRPLSEEALENLLSTRTHFGVAELVKIAQSNFDDNISNSDFGFRVAALIESERQAESANDRGQQAISG